MHNVEGAKFYQSVIQTLESLLKVARRGSDRHEVEALESVLATLRELSGASGALLASCEC